jgi:2',3'-cyclic-nucleotide 2'-phosphodiesterase (5'-nucleotidase family)
MCETKHGLLSHSVQLIVLRSGVHLNVVLISPALDYIVALQQLICGTDLQVVEHRHHQITSDVECDSAIADLVQHYVSSQGEKLQQRIGATAVPLDGRFVNIRTCETNLGNLVADLMLHQLNTDPNVPVHVAFYNAGSVRCDRLLAQGDLRFRDVKDILPYPDDTAVVEMTGARLLKVLENGVSMYPKTEGRFPQVRMLVPAFDMLYDSSACVAGISNLSIRT